jgi:flagellar hook assembly protein FlgD
VLSIIASESELSGEVRSYVDSEVRGGHTYGYVLGVIKMNGTEVQSQLVQVVAKRFELTLSQNHPNPFNPATTISFTLPEKARVHLAIYDVAGRLVATLVDGSLDEGLHTAKWEGRNNNGSQVSSGVYFYRLVAGKEVLTKKMVLLR